MGNHITIDKSSVLEAYKHASEDHKKVLEDLFGKDVFLPQDITERIKTFQDAVSLLGYDNQTVIDYHKLNHINSAKDIIAFAKLRVITEALNEGWKPTYDGNGCLYYARFYVYTKSEYEGLDEDEKEACIIVGCSQLISDAYGGRVFAYAIYASSYAYPYHGSRLAFKTHELAEYCGKQFIDIWADYLFS